MKKFVLFVVSVLLVSLCLGCGSTKKEAAPAKKELIVGTEPAFAPFEFQKAGSSEFTGFDIELIQAMAKKMGYKKCTIRNMGFDALIPALEAKNIDVAIAGMTITEDRKKKVNFSKPYYKSGLSIVVDKNNTTIKDVKDLVGKKIAVQIGTTGAIEAAKIKDAVITSFNTNNEACLELKNKAVDAVIGDKPVEEYFLQQSGKNVYAKIVGKTLTSEDYGIATAKKNAALAKELDKALEALQKDGTYDTLYKKWFGTTAK